MTAGREAIIVESLADRRPRRRTPVRRFLAHETPMARMCYDGRRIIHGLRTPAVEQFWIESAPTIPVAEVEAMNRLSLSWPVVRTRRVAARLATTGTSEEVLIGLEIDLEPGWQFYSESPGEFGAAPVFDWTASRNLAKASIFWPEATQFLYSVDPPVSTLGYKGSVLLPVVLEVGKLDDDLHVRLDLEYAVCDEICIFDTVGLRLTLPAGRSEATRHSTRLQRALTDAKARPE